MQKTEYLIIGAGLSGSYLAYRLQKNGEDCLIIEKSSGIGGRLATRRIDNYPFDHGLSQIPKVKTMADLLKEIDLTKKIIETPSGQFLIGGINQIAKVLNAKVEVLRNTKVEKILMASDSWLIECENGEKFKTKKIILTAPMPQALELLKKNNILPPASLKLEQITYYKSLIALLISDSNFEIPKNLPHGLKSVSRTQEKNSHPQGYIFEASANFSEIHFEKSDDEIMRELKKVIFETMGDDFKIQNLGLKKWRYATPYLALLDPFLEIIPGLYLIGDSFIEPSAVGALNSSEALATHLIKKS